MITANGRLASLLPPRHSLLAGRILCSMGLRCMRREVLD